MSGQIIGQVIGTVAGSFLGPVGAVIGGAIGGAVGSSFDTLPTQYGPKLEDLRPQSSEYGKPIPIVKGTVGMGGNVFWASDYVEVETETEQGGKGGPSQSTVTYSYFGNFAVAFAEGECDIGRIWAGPSKRLIYDGMMLEGGGTVRIYRGTEDQMPDPLIESYLGAGNVPAYRGICYAVFEMFPLEKDGNTLPFITAEVGAKAGVHGKDPVLVTDQIIPPDSFKSSKAVVDPLTGWVWIVEDVLLEGTFRVQVINDAKQEVIAEWTLAAPWGGVTTKTLHANGGLVWILTEPWVLAMRRAGVANFTSGQANPDGSVKEMPQFMSWMKLGRDGSPTGPDYLVEKPMDPVSIFSTDADVWVAYSLTNATALHLAYFPIAAMSFVPGDTAEAYSQNSYGEFFPGAIIGDPYYMAGDIDVIGIVGRGGGLANPNFAVIDARTGVALHTVRWDISGTDGKSFDYDPKRKKFIAWTGAFPGAVTTLDAITGEIEVVPLSSASGDTDPAPAPTPKAVTYSSRTDRYLIGGSFNPSNLDYGSTVWIIDPETLATQAAVTFEAGGNISMPLLDPALNKGAPYVLAFDDQLDRLVRLYIGGEVAAAPANLGDIVMDLSLRAGLLADQVDVSELVDMVPGYAIARQTTVRAAIDALRPAYYFDAVESGGKVKFVKRGKQSIAIIDDDDLDAHQADGQPGDPLLTTRQMEVELPNVVNVNYMSAATDYEKATKLARRLVGASGEEATLDLPLVLTDTKGQEIAEVNLHTPWVERIKYGPFNLPRKYSYIEPTDVITVKGYDMRLEKVAATPGGILTCEAVATDSSTYVPHVVVTETVPTEKVVFVPGETTLELM